MMAALFSVPMLFGVVVGILLGWLFHMARGRAGGIGGAGGA